MIESKYTFELSDRQSDAIKKLVDEMNSKNFAFFYKDLKTLAKLINLTFKRILQKKVLIIKLFSIGRFDRTFSNVDKTK